MKARKTTVIAPCDNHAWWFAGMTRRRQAECWVEGGPASSRPCAETPCQIKAGTDFFGESSLADVEAMPATTWTANR